MPADAKKLSTGRCRRIEVARSTQSRRRPLKFDGRKAVIDDTSAGTGDVDENAPDAELARLNAAGVRGVRVNVNPIKPPEPGFSKTMLSLCFPLK